MGAAPFTKFKLVSSIHMGCFDFLRDRIKFSYVPNNQTFTC